MRQEKPADYPAVFEIIEEAFRKLEMAYGTAVVVEKNE